MPLLRLAELEVLWAVRVAVHWVHRVHPLRACFRARSAYSSTDRPPRSCSSGSSFRARPPLQSSFASAPARSLSGTGPLPGFRPSSRHHRARPPAAGAPNSPLRSVLRCSQPLDGFLRAPASRACFIPQPPPGIVPRSGGSLPAQPRFLIESVVPPCRWQAPALRAFARRPRTARAGFEALLRAGPRAGDSVVSLLADRSPPRVRPPPGPLSRREPRLTQGHPLMESPPPNPHALLAPHARA